MERNEQITQAIYDAIGELNEALGPDQALAKSPDTVLIGESSTLDSLGIVTLITSVEERVERTFNHTLSLMDVIVRVDANPWTVSSMAKCIEEMVGASGAAK
ncbi:MAG: hypothetical protein ACYTEZ_08670 [Planctomycetota bacterium]|jgi:acyl carrier protein